STIECHAIWRLTAIRAQDARQRRSGRATAAHLPFAPVTPWRASHFTSLAGLGYLSGSASYCALVTSDPSTVTLGRLGGISNASATDLNGSRHARRPATGRCPRG